MPAAGAWRLADRARGADGDAGAAADAAAAHQIHPTGSTGAGLSGARSAHIASAIAASICAVRLDVSRRQPRPVCSATTSATCLSVEVGVVGVLELAVDDLGVQLRGGGGHARVRLWELHEGQSVVALESERYRVVAPRVVGDLDDWPARGDPMILSVMLRTALSPL